MNEIDPVTHFWFVIAFCGTKKPKHLRIPFNIGGFLLDSSTNSTHVGSRVCNAWKTIEYLISGVC